MVNMHEALLPWMQALVDSKHDEVWAHHTRWTKVQLLCNSLYLKEKHTTLMVWVASDGGTDRGGSKHDSGLTTSDLFVLLRYDELHQVKGRAGQGRLATCGVYPSVSTRTSSKMA